MKSLALALLSASAIPGSAYAATYVTGTASYTGLGDPGGSFDQVTLVGASGSGTAPGDYLFNTIDFKVGPKSTPAGGVYTGVFTDTITKDGGAPFTYSLPYVLTTGATDTIVIGGNTINYRGYNITFPKVTLTGSGGTVSAPASGTVTSAPEPAAWALMIIGFGSIGLAMRRRLGQAPALV